MVVRVQHKLRPHVHVDLVRDDGGIGRILSNLCPRINTQVAAWQIDGPREGMRVGAANDVLLNARNLAIRIEKEAGEITAGRSFETDGCIALEVNDGVCSSQIESASMPLNEAVPKTESGPSLMTYVPDWMVTLALPLTVRPPQ